MPLIIISSLHPDEKSSQEIQQEIDSRNNQIMLLREEIKKTENLIIKKTQDEISESQILIDLQNKINLIKKLIKSIDNDERLIKKQIDLSTIEIIENEELIVKLQNKIKKNIVYAYKKGMPNLIDLIFNLKDLNDITYKAKYLNSINDFQKNNKQQLKKAIEDLKQKKIILNKKLKNKNQLRIEKEKEKKELNKTVNQKNELLKKINQDKEKEKNILSNKKKDLEEIENIINNLYSDKLAQEQREKELAEIRKLQKITINGNFSSMKGKLPWPIKGKIISKFGNKRNKELNTITENLGIDIKSNQDKTVIAVLDGIVSSITYIRGVGNIIIIDHGDGFNTVYSNIKNIAVEENQYISAGSKIANVDENRILHFQIWHKKEKENPEKWLLK